MSRFPAELIVTLTDGSSVTEYFNQAEMAQFTRATILECIKNGDPVLVFDGETKRIPPERVSAVKILVQDAAGAAV